MFRPNSSTALKLKEKNIIFIILSPELPSCVPIPYYYSNKKNNKTLKMNINDFHSNNHKTIK